GRLMAVAEDVESSPFNPSIRVFDLESGKETLLWNGVGYMRIALAFSRDGARLASGMGDTTILLWDTSTKIHEQKNEARQLTRREFQRYWSELVSVEPLPAYRAIWSLAGHPKEAPTFLKEQLKPRPGLDMARVRRLIADLDSDRFTKREAASR